VRSPGAATWVDEDRTVVVVEVAECDADLRTRILELAPSGSIEIRVNPVAGGHSNTALP